MFDQDIDRQRVERCASLIGMVREAAERMLTTVDTLNADILETKIGDACAPAVDDWEAK